jgi:glycosyltransferase involved in cell wall biosynthesis
MKVLVLSKRQYTGKDLLDDRFGRMYEIPVALAGLGHEVRGLVLSYRRRGHAWFRWEDVPGINWCSVDALRGTATGLPVYFRQCRDTMALFSPDVVWAGSDAFHAILAWRLCAAYRVPLVVDLYDNFESFGATRLPGITALFRRACRDAAGLTVIGEVLNDWVETVYRPRGMRLVLGNGVDTKLFQPQDKRIARETLGLPVEVRLIGTAGAITAHRGIADLFEAFLRLAAMDENLYLVYAGRRDETYRRYQHPRILYLGVLPYERIPLVFSALDVAVLCNRDSDFGNFCFPQKLYEILASRTPLVAASVSEVRRLLAGHEANLYPPGNPEVLAARVAALLADPEPINDVPVVTWRERGSRLESFLAEIGAGKE